MHHSRRRRTLAALLLASLVVVSAALTLRAAPPTAPTNLRASVNGLLVTFTWDASANSPTQYILQAGFAPGQTAVQVALDGSLTSFSASAGPGTYYVRLIAVNADGSSSPSNEVVVTLTTGCAPPSRPLNLRAIIRGTEAFIFWQRPMAGTPTAYTLQAGSAPGHTFTQVATAGRTLNTVQAAGTFYLRVVATSPCGTSPASNEIVVSFPGNTVKVEDPEPGTTLGMPDVAALIARIHSENPGLINQSCPNRRKYENNPWQDRMIDRLRQYDLRFGYNGKPTKTSADNAGFPVIAAGDEFTFFAGAGTAQGSRTVYVVDMLFRHCGEWENPPLPPELTYRDFTGEEEAFWTGAGRFTMDERD